MLGTERVHGVSKEPKFVFLGLVVMSWYDQVHAAHHESSRQHRRDEAGGIEAGDPLKGDIGIF